MRECPNCSGQAPDNKKYCPHCGERLIKKRRMSKKGRAAAAGLAAFVAAAAFFAMTLLTRAVGPTDRERFVDRHRLIFVEPVTRALRGDLPEMPDTPVTVQVTLRAQAPDSDIAALLKMASVTVKVTAGSGGAVANAAVRIMGSPLLSAEGTYLDGTLGVRFPQIDEGYYTARPEVLIPAVIGQTPDIPAPDGELLADIIERYAEAAFTAVTDESLTVEKGGEYEFKTLSGTVETDIYISRPEAPDIERALLNVAETMEGDDQLRELLGLYLDDPEGAVEAAAEHLRENAGRYGQIVEDAGFTWTLAADGVDIYAIGGQAMGIEAGFERSGQEGDDPRLYLIAPEGSVTASFSMPETPAQAPDTAPTELETQYEVRRKIWELQDKIFEGIKDVL